MSQYVTKDDVAPLLEGERRAVAAFVRVMTPIVQARVAKAMRGFSIETSRARQELEDGVQDTFLALFSSNSKLLHGWDPERGLSFENFVGLIAYRLALSKLRTRKNNPFNADPTLDTDLERDLEPSPALDESVIQRDLMAKVVMKVRSSLSPRGLSLFTALIIEEREIEDVMMEESMSRDALYAWRSRLLKAIKQEYQLMTSDPAPSTQSSSHGR